MDEENSPQWRPAPEPQNELDRLMLRAADPALHGKMFRMLWESELSIFVPPHPELVGEHMRSVDEGFIWCSYGDVDGAFSPVFTSLACAQYEIRNAGKPAPMIVSMPADVLFGFLNNGRTTVRVMAAGGGTVRMEPESVAEFVKGTFTHNRPDTAEAEQVTLHPVPVDKVPSKLREGIRVFCAKRRVPIGVYVFHQADAVTGEVPGNDLRVVLWLRSTDNDFYNDFCLMGQKLTPRHLEFFCGVVSSDDVEGVAFLQRCTPLWPIVKEG